MTRRAGLRLRGNVALVAALVAAVVALDGIATAASWLTYRHAPPRMPHFAADDIQLRDRSLDAYSPMPAVYGFSAISLPASVTDDGNGHLTYTVDGTRTLYPDVNAGYALDAVDRFRRTGDRRWLRRAENAIEPVVDARRDWMYPHDFETRNDLSQAVAPGWFSAQTQGLVLSAAVRLAELTGAARWRTVARETFNTFLRFHDFADEGGHLYADWLSTVDEKGYLWFEKYPSALTPTEVITGHDFALVGIYDFWRTTRVPLQRETARLLLVGGVTTLRHAIGEVRDPRHVSTISILVGDRDLRSHRGVIEQAGLLARATGDRRLRELVRELTSDVARPAILQGTYPPQGDVDVYSPMPFGYGYSAADLPPNVRDDGTGHVLARIRGHEVVDPDVNAGYALDALDRYRRHGRDPRWLSRAETAMTQVLATGRDGIYPHDSEATDAFGRPLAPGWYSAETQGLVLSALVRLARITSEPKWTAAARVTFATFTRFQDYPGPDGAPPRDWVSRLDNRGYVWFESNPTAESPTTLVTAHLTGIIGVYDYWRLTHDTRAAELVGGGGATLAHYLPSIRRKGHTSTISVLVDEGDRSLHDRLELQLRAMSQLTGRPLFDAYASLLAGDVATEGAGR